MSDEPEETNLDTEGVPEEPEAPVLEEPVIETTAVEEAEEVKPEKKEKKAKKGDLSPEEIAEQERLQKIIDEREVIEMDPVHVPV